MARKLGKLSALSVSRLKEKGMYADGGGLYLQVTASGSKSWSFRYMREGSAHEMGLGPVHAVDLGQARKKATECRRQLAEGVDPLLVRRADHERLRLEEAQAMTFKGCAEAYIRGHKAGWRNPKHAGQWEGTLKAYAYPVIGDLSVQAVDLSLVMKILEPIWTTKTETASRLRGRIEAILDWAAVRGYRKGDNPARWRGHIETLLPKRSKVQPVAHHPALQYAEIGSFMSALRAQPGVAAMALEFLILTASRTGEVIEAQPNEIDLSSKTWTVPPERMKAGREHRVPLSARAVEIAAERLKAGDQFLFPGAKRGRPLSNMALLAVLKRMSRSDLTAHGFRSTFRDWAAECTSFAREVAESALAHTISDKVEAAYRRGDLFRKRRQLMDAWDRACASPPATGNVVSIGVPSATASPRATLRKRLV